MTMQDHVDACKRRAFEMKATHPHIQHMKRLDLAAQSLGYAHYTALDAQLKRLGPHAEPEGTAPKPTDAQVGLAAPPGFVPMTLPDIRAAIERCPLLTYHGYGVSPDDVRHHGTHRAALEAGQRELLGHLDECNKALRFLSHVRKRKSINDAAGSSYGLKHAVEYFLNRLKNPPENRYVANGAFFCAAIHAGFDYRSYRGSPNPHFNMSMRSPAFEWRDIDSRRGNLINHPKLQRRYLELCESLGVMPNPELARVPPPYDDSDVVEFDPHGEGLSEPND